MYRTQRRFETRLVLIIILIQPSVIGRIDYRLGIFINYTTNTDLLNMERVIIGYNIMQDDDYSP